MFAHCSVRPTFALQCLHAAADASGNAYWRPTLAIACSPLDAGQTDVMIDRHDRPMADFRDAEHPPWEKLKKDNRIVTGTCQKADILKLVGPSIAGVGAALCCSSPVSSDSGRREAWWSTTVELTSNDLWSPGHRMSDTVEGCLGWCSQWSAPNRLYRRTTTDNHNVTTSKILTTIHTRLLIM